jgi:hypothetical protein
MAVVIGLHSLVFMIGANHRACLQEQYNNIIIIIIIIINTLHSWSRSVALHHRNSTALKESSPIATALLFSRSLARSLSTCRKRVELFMYFSAQNYDANCT